ncbi:MAG: MaoC/PaaZ C-terminal domain-containing protein [Pseudochelatococcus sp.]|jgi:acyl dehydratase|uniref:MaoC/PaaZ C-terminal domain-containing protein n=1 Tax=Pseudochelatococcus sp. TaxID=2020869 RepID=UPI003D903786
MSKGYCYEDFAPGQVFTTAGRTLTETDLQMFSMLTGDWNPIHSDAEYAATTRFGERLLHGTLGIGLCIGMLHPLGIFDGTVVAMLSVDNWRFLRPLTIGMTVHLELEIIEKEPGRSGRTGRIGRLFRLKNQHGEVVQEGRADVLVMTRAGLPDGKPA